MKMTHNNIFITGGATGIGYALAERFVKAGNTVTVCGRRRDVLNDAAKRCPGLNVIQADLAQPHSREELAQAVLTAQPQCNILINNAGIQCRPPNILEIPSWESYHQEISINFEAPLHLSLLFAQHLSKQKDAAIINITSGLAFVPLTFMPTYCATKAALHSLTVSLRHQFTPHNIDVIEIAPPAVNTDLGGKGLHDFGVPLNEFADFAFKKLSEGDKEFGYQSSELARTANAQDRAIIFSKMNAAL